MRLRIKKLLTLLLSAALVLHTAPLRAMADENPALSGNGIPIEISADNALSDNNDGSSSDTEGLISDADTNSGLTDTNGASLGSDDGKNDQDDLYDTELVYPSALSDGDLDFPSTEAEDIDSDVEDSLSADRVSLSEDGAISADRVSLSADGAVSADRVSLSADGAVSADGVSLSADKDVSADAAAAEEVPGSTDDEGEELSGGNVDTFFDFPSNYKLQSTAVNLPTSYSSVEEGYVNTPKDQGSTEHCWAYTSMSIAETNMMKKFGLTAEEASYDPEQFVRDVYNYNRDDYFQNTTGDRSYVRYLNSDKTANLYVNTSKDPDSSGTALKNNAYFTKAVGSLAWSTFALARWAGPKMNYFPELPGDEADSSYAHLENAYWVPNNDIKAIKTLIYKYGSVGIQIRATTTGAYAVNSRNYRYNPNIPASGMTNHAVTLVGWDDGMARSNFTNSDGNTPNSNGGFIVKNSYGTGKYDNGYFYISYEDGAFKYYNKAARIAVAFDFGEADNYDHIYSYDGANGNSSYATRRMYVTYKAKNNLTNTSELLKAIGVGLADAGRYKIGLYYHSNESGKALNQYPITEFLTSIPYTGYHTIELPVPILLLHGDEFTISVEKSDSSIFNALVDTTYRTVSAVNPANTSGVSGDIIFTTEETTGDVYFVDSSTGKVVSGNSIRYGYTYHANNEKGVSTLYYEKRGVTPRVKAYTDFIDRPALADQSNLEISLEKYIWFYTGSNVNPQPVVMLKEPNCIIMSKYYNTTYANHKDAGIAAVVVRGNSNVTDRVFSGEISAAFKISKDQISIRNASVFGVEDQEYRQSGGYSQDHIVVRYFIKETRQYVTLKEGIDYEIGSIEGENSPGKKNTIMITGVGAFRNTVKPKFKIQKANKPKPICDSTVTVSLSMNGEPWNDLVHEVEYTGSKIMPTVTLYDTATGRQLVQGIDYKKISFKKNKNPGLAEVVVKAMGGSSAAYSGKVVRYFLIRPLKITTDATLEIKPNSYKYTGKEIKPKPIVKLYGKRISNNYIYTIYLNNKGTSGSTITAQAIVFGRGKYDGYIGYTTFTIK